MGGKREVAGVIEMWWVQRQSRRVYKDEEKARDRERGLLWELRY